MTQAANTGLAWRNLLVAGAVVLASLPAQASAAALSAGVNVKDYGAVGDGTTDDTNAIANALASGRSVLFPAGVYLTGAQSISSAGQIMFGEGAASVVKASTAASHLFTVAADHVGFADLRLNGAATSNANNTFAIYTAPANPAKYLSVERVIFSGADATRGFNNAIKLDTGSNNAAIIGCNIDRLFGSISGTGYGVLCGQVSGCKVEGNWMQASAGRGRHGVYLSAGASECLVQGNNVSGFDFEGITQYAGAGQPPCTGNIIIGNNVSHCALSSNPTSGAIGVYGHSSRVLISSNIVKNSGAKGIAIDGAGFTDCADTVVDGNTVTNSSLIGIDVIAGVRGSITNNLIRESSLASVGVSPNIRLVSDGVTASSGFLISGNNSSGPVYSRSAFQLNATVPVPFNLTVTGNRFEPCNLATVELGGVTCAIDGRLRYSIAITPPSLAKGASYSLGGLSLPDAVPGDTLAWSYRGYSGNCDGCIMTVAITSAGSAQYVIANLSTGTKTPTAGTLDIDVFKRPY